MRRDAVDWLIQMAFLEGAITTHGLYEKVAGRRIPKRVGTAASRKRLIERLESVLVGNATSEEEYLTIGGFLRNLRSDASLRPQEIFTRLGVSQNLYRMIEHDRLSPLKIPVEAWRRFREVFCLPVETLGEMIRRTHQLVLFRPAFNTTLARYDARKNKGLKRRALEQAATELYAKARLTLPSDDERKIRELLDSIARNI